MKNTNDEKDIFSFSNYYNARKSFCNEKGKMVKIVWIKDPILLNEEKAASGFWCKNDQYELRGKAKI